MIDSIVHCSLSHKATYNHICQTMYHAHLLCVLDNHLSFPLSDKTLHFYATQQTMSLRGYIKHKIPAFLHRNCILRRHQGREMNRWITKQCEDDAGWTEIMERETDVERTCPVCYVHGGFVTINTFRRLQTR